jgi:hypothetical protein
LVRAAFGAKGKLCLNNKAAADAVHRLGIL